MQDNSKQAVLITGGATGIGFAIAAAFIKAGVQTVIAGRDEAKPAAAAKKLGGGAHALQLDVTSEASVAKAFERLTARGLAPDILVNNAGAAATAPFERTSLDDWRAMLDVNLTGAFLCARAALPHMKKSGFGRIITIASTAGLKGYAYTAAYTAAKHGVIGMTRALALELAGSGVTANAVCPGFTETDIVRDSVKNIMKKTGRSEAEAMKALTKHNPEGRLISPEEVAHTVMWLANGGASAINGQAIAVAGGEVM